MTASPDQFPVQNVVSSDSFVIPTGLRQHFQAPDYGCDTHNRFRYQATCAALCALCLLDKNPSHEAVYCELLEDILLRCKKGSFVAIQVKTCEKGLDSFKTKDSEMLTSIGRFIEYEQTGG